MDGSLTTIRAFLQSFGPVIPRAVISMQNNFIIDAIKPEVFLCICSPIDERTSFTAVRPVVVLLNETSLVCVM